MDWGEGGPGTLERYLHSIFCFNEFRDYGPVELEHKINVFILNKSLNIGTLVIGFCMGRWLKSTLYYIVH